MTAQVIGGLLLVIAAAVAVFAAWHELRPEAGAFSFVVVGVSVVVVAVLVPVALDLLKPDSDADPSSTASTTSSPESGVFEEAPSTSTPASATTATTPFAVELISNIGPAHMGAYQGAGVDEVCVFGILDGGVYPKARSAMWESSPGVAEEFSSPREVLMEGDSPDDARYGRSVWQCFGAFSQGQEVRRFGS